MMEQLLAVVMGGNKSSGRLLARLHWFTALSFVAALAIAAAFAALSWQTLALHEQKNAEIVAANQGAVLQESLDRSLSAAYALASVLREGHGKIANFDALAKEMLLQYRGISSLQLARGGIITDVMPRKGNEAILGHDLLSDPTRDAAVRRAIATRQLTLAGPYDLIQGGVGVIGRLPVYLPDAAGHEQFWGLTTVLVKIPDLLASTKLDALRSAGYDYQLSHTDVDAGKFRMLASAGATTLVDPVLRTITVPNGSWELRIAPAQGWVPPYLSAATVAGAVLVALFVAAFTHTVLSQPMRLRHDVEARTVELARTNQELKEEMVQREKAQRAAVQINRLYSVLSHTNGTIIRATNCDQLFQNICDVAVQHGGYPLAAISTLEPIDGKDRWVSRATEDVLVPECDCAGCSTAPAALPGEDDGAPASPCMQARLAGYESHVMFPLTREGQRIGMFCLYAYGPRFFDAAQMRLLEEMTNDVSFALDHLEHEERRKRGEDKLRKLSRAVEQSANAVVITDVHGTIEYVNPWFTRITGYAPEDVLGKNPRILKSNQTLPETYKRLWDTLLSGKEWHGELHNTKKNGELYWCLEAISPLKNEHGEVTHFVAITEDISERKQTEQTIRHLAFHDVLTGLPNRRLFRDRLLLAMAGAQRSRAGFALMLLDLDHFKTINDTLGHDAGDALLTVVAQRLGERIRGNDTLARMGGDEFALLAIDIDQPDEVARLAEALQDALRAPIMIGDQQLYLTTSVGITLYPGDAKDVDALVKHADIALYRAKDLGRDNFQFFTDDMNQAIVERMNLTNKMRTAIERQQFVLYYQPQVDMTSGQIHSVEALIRWNHPELGLVAPSQFIPLAEETGMIVAIGDWVLRTACQQARAWELAGMPLRIAVNLSARQFRQGDLANKIENMLRETDLRSDLLEVEMTEGILMEDTASTSATLDTLHRMGLQISIDDFGTGYSSLSYLKRLPIDILKIDQSFVRDIYTDPDDRSIVTAIIALAHSLQLKVVAEGVETPEQLAFLRGQGCDTIQGYLFSRPVAGEQILALFQSGKRLVD